MSPAPPLRVVVTGSESTGKTTLAQQLAHRFGTLWVPEFSRAYAERHSHPLGAADVEPIARGQIALEEEYLARAREAMLVFDTDLTSTTVFAEFYYGACPTWIRREAGRRRGDLYLLADIDVPWVADRVRDQPLARDELHDRIRERLREIGAHTVDVIGLGPARLAAAITAVETFLRERTPLL
jgi:NadR type nicotinamide-nucleotide adenylyltransferase